MPIPSLLVSHCLYTPPAHPTRNASPNSRLRQAIFRQFRATISQLQLFRWSSGNRCICLCGRLKPLCPYSMRYSDLFIIPYKKVSELQWYIQGKSLEDFKRLRKGTNSFSDIILIQWTVFALISRNTILINSFEISFI